MPDNYVRCCNTSNMFRLCKNNILQMGKQEDEKTFFCNFDLVLCSKSLQNFLCRVQLLQYILPPPERTCRKERPSFSSVRDLGRNCPCRREESNECLLSLLTSVQSKTPVPWVPPWQPRGTTCSRNRRPRPRSSRRSWPRDGARARLSRCDGPLWNYIIIIQWFLLLSLPK